MLKMLNETFPSVQTFFSVSDNNPDQFQRIQIKTKKYVPKHESAIQ